MMEKRLNDKVNPLTVDDIRDDLTLRFEKLNEKTNDNENEDNQDVAFLVVSSRDNAEIVV
jgi:hypothetical protein